MECGTKCLLVYPEFSKYSSLNYTDICNIMGAKYPAPPLGLMTVAALLPQNWQFKLIDINVEPLLDKYFEWADIVCTGGLLSQQIGILAIIEKVHQYGKKVIVGGPEPTSQPHLYGAADYLVIGEGENTIPELLKDMENGCGSGEYKSVKMSDMSRSVVPRYDLINFADYLMMGIQFSRGCPYDCEFCNVIEIFGRKLRTKTDKSIIEELECLHNLGYRGHIFFVDDNFFGNRKCAEKLLMTVGKWSRDNKYPFYFGAEVTLNLIDDDKLLQLAKDVDFRFISIGIETPDDFILQKIQKKQNVGKSIPQVIKKIYSYGIVVDASFILGFDHEDEKTADKLINCIQDSGICMAMIGTLYALPNTQLIRRLKKEGRLKEDDTVIKNENIEIDQMSSGLNFITSRPRVEILSDYIKILKYLYDPANYYQRLINTGLNLKRNGKYKPDTATALKLIRAFLILCVKAGFNKATSKLYWQTVFIILIKNPKALELVLSLAAMYIHLSKQFQFIIKLTEKKIDYIKNYGEESYIESELTKTMNH